MGVPFFVSLLTACLFYVIIPVGGAFWVRAQWRRFRSRVLSCSLKKEIHYGDFRQPGEGHLGDYRFIGTLQAIQGDDIIWVTNGSVSLPIHLQQVTIYTLPHSFLSAFRGGLLSLRESLPDEIPRRISWNRMFSLHEGTRILICGGLCRENGQLLFRSSPSQKLMVLIYDGSEDSILARCLWGGRQKNEYINDLSPWSIILGALILLLEAYFFYRQPLNFFAGRLTALLGVAPLTVFFPPGVLFFELYRILWRRGRIFRAERDMVRLPLRFWPEAHSMEECLPTPMPHGGIYGFHRYETGREGLDKNPRENLLDLSVLRGEDNLDKECFAFGSLDEEGEGEFAAGSDILTGVILLPGDPFELAALSARRARRMEILSGLSCSVGIGMNLILLFFLMNTLLP